MKEGREKEMNDLGPIRVIADWCPGEARMIWRKRRRKGKSKDDGGMICGDEQE